MKVSIIGAGRNRSGIGEYIGKYFQKNGASVTSVLGTTEETSQKASSSLAKYGIDSHPYTDFDKMVEEERPDTVVIASPSSTHYAYLLRCADLGLNIFCEKPFIRPDLDDVGQKIEEVFQKTRERKRTVAMNSQWPFAIKYYERICGEIEIRKLNRFFIKMSPFASGEEMISEAVPHALSLLYFVFRGGEIEDLDFELTREEEMTIKLRYLFGKKDCEVLIKLDRREKQPRDLEFGFNNKIVKRSLNLKNYDIYLSYGNRRVRITDPLELSVRDFISSIGKKVEPVVGYTHILHNMTSLKKIYDSYHGVRLEQNG